MYCYLIPRLLLLNFYTDWNPENPLIHITNITKTHFKSIDLPFPYRFGDFVSGFRSPSPKFIVADIQIK